MYYEKFGGVLLPVAQKADVSAGEARSNIMDLPGGGMWDADGSTLVDVGQQTVTARFDVVGGCAAEMRELYDALSALRGTSGQLYRRYTDGARRWKYARLLSVDATWETPAHLHLKDVAAMWALKSPCWYGLAHDLTFTLDTSPKTLALPNNGNWRNTEAVLTLTAVGETITDVEIAVAGATDIAWSGTLAAGQALVIDCGARTVRRAGIDAYNGFTYEAGHAMPFWLILEPGDNSVVVTLNAASSFSIAGSSTLRVQYADGWA